ncbi:MAG: hypothetical protein BVN33_14770 [Proteobacteria bacterium ST_bin13]|nr:MAG: hypothetical protein BVN33_14770 [Proteobacteria bacterium ST_bin13]
MLPDNDELECRGRRLADDGYGWCDLVVLLSISEEEARRFVRQAEFRRMSEAYRSKQPSEETL